MLNIYHKLLDMYGHQGWWPLHNIGYHPGEYDYPKNRTQRFEICIGAILTQNVAWKNVEQALDNLHRLDAIEPQTLVELDEKTLKDAIRPAGYYNQKARKLRIFTEFFKALDETPSREELLLLWGIGKETADSILLYAFRQPVFVVDIYTKRIFSNLGHISKDDSYDEVQKLFHEKLEPDVAMFQEYHALIVEHAKKYYKGRKQRYECPLQS